MALLAVLDRELRCAVRRPSTWGSRLLLPIMTFMMSVIGLWFVTLYGVSPIPGRDLFQALSWISFGGACLVGASITSDLISEEKREGTLGLLFLTNLRGAEVVMGKFLCAAIAAFYAVVSVLPILSLPMLMGAAQPGDVLRTTLALLVTLYFGMSIGILVSTLFLNPWKVSGTSMLVMMLFTAGLPALAALVGRYYSRPDLAMLFMLFSPSGMFVLASVGGGMLSGMLFWKSVLILTGLASAALIGAVLLVPRFWKDRVTGLRMLRFKGWWMKLTRGGSKEAADFRARLLDFNPFTWLVLRRRFPSVGFLIAVAGFMGIALWIPTRYQTGRPQDDVELQMVCLMVLFFGVCLLTLFKTASLGSQRFTLDRKSGALELILSTRLSVAEIIHGQWHAIFRQLWGGVVGILLLHLLLLNYMQILMHHTGTEPTVWIGIQVVWNFLVYGEATSQFEDLLVPLIFSMGGVLFLLTCVAAAWMSMWCSMRINNSIRAPWLAVIAAIVPPWPIFVTTMVQLNKYELLPNSNQASFLLGASIAIGLVATNAFFWIWYARRQLYRRFRIAATDRYRLSAFQEKLWGALRWVGIERKRI